MTLVTLIPAYAHGGTFPHEPPPFHVIHSTEGPMSIGNAVGLAKWFARSPDDGGPGTSASRIFDPRDEVPMLSDRIVPYHVGPVGNSLGTGDEHCGSVSLTTAQWLSDDGKAMLDMSARRAANLAHARGWTLAQCRWLTLTEVAAHVPGFCTHNDIRLALGGTTHSDPGPNFPYSWYMNRVRAWYQDPTNGGNDDMAYTDWPMADRLALCDDVIRFITRGVKPDGTLVQHIADASTGRIVELVNLARVGDDPDPTSGDTHPNLATLSEAVAMLETTVDQRMTDAETALQKILERLPETPPTV